MSKTESKFYKRFLLNLFFIFSFISIIEFSSATISKVMFGRKYRVEHFLARILSGNFGIQKSEDVSSKLFKNLVDLRKSGTKVYPVYSYDPQMHAPLEKYWISRPSNTKILRKNEGSGNIIFKTNKLGYRETINEDLSKNIDIVFLGGSFAEGCCVKTGSTIPDFIAKSTGLNVINVGMAGTGPLMQLGVLTELIENKKVNQLLNPQTKIIWIIYPGNTLRELREEKGTTLSNYLIDGYSQNYFENIYDISLKQKKFIDRIVNNQMGENTKVSNKSLPGNHGKGETLTKNELQFEIKNYEKILEKIVDRSKKNNLNLSIVLLDNYPTFNSNSFDAFMRKTLAEKIREEAVESKTKIVDISFKDIKPRKIPNAIARVNAPYGHFDEEGYEEVSKIIIKEIIDIN